MNKRITITILSLLLPASGFASELHFLNGQQTVSLEISGVEQLAKAGWEEVSEDVWTTTLENGADAEVTFGNAAFERATRWLDEEIEQLQGLGELTEEQDLRLFESLIRREQLSKWSQERSPDKLTDTSSESVCWGSASFEHTYGFMGFVTPTVQSTSFYSEFGPLSSGTKTAYARARVCGSGSYCNQNTDSASGGSVWAVLAATSASVSPFWGCTADAFGYVLVLEASGCSDLVAFSTNHTCTEFINDQI